MSYNYSLRTDIDYPYENQQWVAAKTANIRRPQYVPGASNPNAAYTTTNASGAQTYASGISDNGFKANKCTDGKDDGKIGFWAAAGNAIEGVAKGAVNGVKGALGIEEDGSWNPLKALGTVALVGASIAFPVVGVVACAVGAVSGAAQIGKGVKAAANATTDAEAKAAWENIGEGTSTVIGCVTGAKASMGAMKTAAATDDIAKVAGKVDDILGSVDDATKALGKNSIDSADDIAKMTKFLKSKGIDNADEIMKAAEKGSSVDDILMAAAEKGKMSKLSQVDDTLKGLDKLKAQGKAFGEDALSSSKNNFGKITTKVKTTTNKTQYSKAADNLDDATKALNEVSGSIDDVTKAKYKDSSVDDITKAIDDLSKNADANKDEIKYLEALKKQKTAEASYKTARGKLSDDVAKQVDVDRSTSKYKKANDELNAASEKIKKLTTDKDGEKLTGKEFDDVLKSDEYKKANEARKKASDEMDKIVDGLDDATKSKVEEMKVQESARQTAKNNLEVAKENAKGAKKDSAEYKAYQKAKAEYNKQYGNGIQKGNAYIKDKINNSNTADYLDGKKIKDVKISELGKEAMQDVQNIINFLEDGNNIPEAIAKFGYDNVMEVMYLTYGIGHTQTSV